MITIPTDSENENGSKSPKSSTMTSSCDGLESIPSTVATSLEVLKDNSKDEGSIDQGSSNGLDSLIPSLKISDLPGDSSSVAATIESDEEDDDDYYPKNRVDDETDLSSGSTWDYSLLQKTENDTNNGTVFHANTFIVPKTDFALKLETFNLESCAHEMFPIACPCTEKINFKVCRKCHVVFCSNKCFKSTLANDGDLNTADKEPNYKHQSCQTDEVDLLPKHNSNASKSQNVIVVTKPDSENASDLGSVDLDDRVTVSSVASSLSSKLENVSLSGTASDKSPHSPLPAVESNRCLPGRNTPRNKAKDVCSVSPKNLSKMEQVFGNLLPRQVLYKNHSNWPNHQFNKVLRDPGRSVSHSYDTFENYTSGYRRTPIFPLNYRTKPHNSKAANYGVDNEAAGDNSIKPGFPKKAPVISSTDGSDSCEESNKSRSPSVASSSSNATTYKIQETPFILSGIPMEVGYSYGDSIFDFFVYTKFGVSVNNKVSRKTQHIYLKKPKAINVGNYYLAKYSYPESGVDGFFRARVIKVMRNEVLVYYIDYGNEERVNKNDIFELIPEFRNLFPSAIRLRLADFDLLDDASETQLDQMFEDLIQDKWFRATIFKNNVSKETLTGPTPQYDAIIHVNDDGNPDKWINLSELLVQRKLGKIVPLNTGLQRRHAASNLPIFDEFLQEYQGEVTYMKDPNEFYFIPSRNIEARSAIKKRLNGKVKYVELPIEELNDFDYLCVVERNDKTLARAQVTAVVDNQIEVRFIDYGETRKLQLQKLKLLPQELLDLVPMVYRCSLPVFPREDCNWNQFEEDKTMKQLRNITSKNVVIIPFSWERVIVSHIVELYIGESTKGVAKTLLSFHRKHLYELFKVNLKIRDKICLSRIAQAKNCDQTLQDKSTNRPQSLFNDSQELLSDSSQSELAKARQYKVTDIPEPQELTAFKDKNIYECNLIGVKSFNEVCIRMETQIGMLMDLTDSITLWLEEGNHSSCYYCKEETGSDTVFIVPKDHHHCRARVISIDKGIAQLEYIDFYGTCSLSIEKLLPVSPKIMQFPKLMYTVKVAGLEKNPPLLLLEDFMTVTEKLVEKSFLIDMASFDNNGWTVSLKLKQSKQNLVSLVAEKQIWSWEQIFNKGYCLESDLLRRYETEAKWKAPVKVDNLNIATLPLGKYFNGTISKLAEDGGLWLINVDSELKHDLFVLNNQIEQYASKVTACEFLPILDEVFLLFIENAPELEKHNLKGVGKWNRCLRFDTVAENEDLSQSAPLYYRNLDLDEVYCETAETKKFFSFRKITPDFVRVPVGMLECKIKDFNPRLKDKLTKNSDIHFRVVQVIDHVHEIELDGFS